MSDNDSLTNEEWLRDVRDTLQGQAEEIQRLNDYIKRIDREACVLQDKHIALRAALAHHQILLRVARCPERCIGGAVPPDGHQCQWCDERKQALGADDDT